jgi:hypothetical protein
MFGSVLQLDVSKADRYHRPSAAVSDQQTERQSLYYAALQHLPFQKACQHGCKQHLLSGVKRMQKRHSSALKKI